MTPASAHVDEQICSGERFAFGENWQSFVQHDVNVQGIAGAVASLQRILKASDLRGQTFLDIGCGSGLFSLAAVLLGADRVVSFDYDHDPVTASLTLRERAGGSAEKWQILQGSVLDPAFLGTVASADVVYSWGVLHHTGAMWQAVDDAVTKVKPGGLLAIAIYHRMEKKLGGSQMWWHIKRAYNRSPLIGRRLMEAGYAGYLLARQLVYRFQNGFTAPHFL